MIYNAVLNANRAVMNAAKPGNVLSFLILSAESESNQKYCDVTSVENRGKEREKKKHRF